MQRQKQSKEAISHFQKVAQFWKAIKGPPVRPSEDELLIYEKHFKSSGKDGKKNVLIFGATPELRDLALRYETNVNTADISLEMINAMNLLMKQDWHKETIMKCDWLKIPVKDGFFDIAMGDNYLNMLHWSQFKPMIEKTFQLLKRGGILITALLSFCPKENLDPIEILIKKYESGQLALGDVISFADDNMRNPKTKMIAVNDKYKIIDKLYGSGKVKEETMKGLNPWRGPLLLTKISEGEFEKLCHPYFEIVAKDYGKDYQSCRYRPIYVLKKKG